MRDLFKVGATGFIWVVFTVFMFGLFAMASDTYSDGYFFLSTAVTGTLAIFAFMLTARLWQRNETEPELASRQASRKPSRTAKMKRDQADRLDVLMDRLDDDTLIELESLLAAHTQEMNQS